MRACVRKFRRLGLAVFLSVLLCMQTASAQDIIKWVDFRVPYGALETAYKLDVRSQEEDVKLDWITLLAYVTAKNGNNFAKFKNADLHKIAKKLQDGEQIEELTKDLKYYPYFLEVYTAVLNEWVGPYRIALSQDEETGEPIWTEKYGLRAFSPVAEGYRYSHCDDFGVGRTYGYKRRHLGHDMMGLTGTPICAVEGGVVEALGWNKYGGWRIGIRSFDTKRYYYYAHLRQNRPYAEGLAVGTTVSAGDVIGYLGRTGYSNKENVNNIEKSHLHWGLQLVFDESQKEGPTEIWIDVYPLTRFLEKNRVTVARNDETKEYTRKYPFEALQTDAQ